MRSLRFTVAKNAVANIVRGGASAVVAVVLPHFLTRSLGPDRFAGWALMLQLAAYANYLDFGVQTAVARYLAAALEKGDQFQRDRLFSNALAMLSVAGVIALSGLGIVAWQLPHMFRSVPAGLAGDIGAGVLILGFAAAINLPLSAYTGVLVGMQRNEFPAIAIALSRLLGAVAVILAAHRTHSLAWLAVCIAAFNLLAGLVQYAIVNKLLPALRFSFGFLERATTMELIRYCSTLSVWSFAMLLVTGLDVTIVGFFNFQAVGAYSLAATLIMFFTGLIGAAFSAMLAPVAVLQARQQFDRISRLVIVSTRLSTYFSMGTIVLAFLFGERLVRAWVGPAYLSLTLPVLKILLIAQAVRLVGNGYGVVLVGMGLQRYGLVPALIEGVSNLLLSLLAIIAIGPIGVAWATLVAAVIAVTIVVFAVLPTIRYLSIDSRSFLWQGIGIPAVPYLPVFTVLLCRALLERRVHLSIMEQYLPLFLALALSGWWIWNGVNRTLQQLTSAGFAPKAVLDDMET
jgi:O-antigen/teichoic acid export membrane protein